MRTKLMLILLVCAMGLGVALLIGCNKKEESPLDRAAPLLLLNAGEKYFPEIPKGVAE